MIDLLIFGLLTAWGLIEMRDADDFATGVISFILIFAGCVGLASAVLAILLKFVYALVSQ